MSFSPSAPSYLQTTFSLPEAHRPTLETEVEERGWALDLGSEDNATDGTNPEPPKLEIWHALLVVPAADEAAATQLLAPLLPAGAPTWQKVDETTDWQAKSMADFPPLDLGRFYITRYNEAAPQGKIKLNIPANMAFGSGEHATTEGCLALYENLIEDGHRFQNILDMGAGSGILAFAAAKWQNTPALAVDNDAPSVRLCAENAAANGINQQVTSLLSEGFGAPHITATGPYDLIFANILMQPLIDMATPLVAHLAPGGFAILSGYTEDQFEAVENAYQNLGLAVLTRTTRRGWVASVLQKA